MVKTDRRIIASNGRTSLEITDPPFYVKKTEGFDELSVTTVTSQGFDQDGATIINTYVESREMSITGQIKADTTQQMEMLMNKLENLFLPKTDITLNHYYGGVNRTITARVTKTPKFKPSEVSSVREYEVELISASDVWWSDASEKLVQIANIIGQFHFPLIIPKNEGVVFGLKSSAMIVDVFNASAITIGMRIVFIANGELKNPMLFNVNTREFIRINCTMHAGESITVLTGTNKKVTKTVNGMEENFINRIDIAGGGSTFLTLEPGDNLFRYGADDGESFLECRIFYRNKYVGV